MKDEEPKTELLKREMYTHLANLRDRCSGLIASGYPLDVYNQAQSLRSLAGQIESAARRWRDMS